MEQDQLDKPATYQDRIVYKAVLAGSYAEEGRAQAAVELIEELLQDAEDWLESEQENQ